MPKAGYKKCISCENFFDFESFGFTVERGDDEGRAICDSCYSDDGSDPLGTLVLVKPDGDKYEAWLGSYALHGDTWGAEVLEEYAETIVWTSSDAWRGHYDGKAPRGWTRVIDSWFCGFDGHNMNDDMWTLERRLKDNEWDGLPCDILFGFLRTSNVFSTGLEVYIPSSHEEAFKEWLKYA